MEESKTVKRTVAIEVMLSIVGLGKRLDLLEALAEGPRTNSELTKESTFPLGVWGHLRQLVQVGIVKKEIYSTRNVLYRLNPEALHDLGEYFQSLAKQAERSCDGGNAE